MERKLLHNIIYVMILGDRYAPMLYGDVMQICPSKNVTLLVLAGRKKNVLDRQRASQKTIKIN